MKEEFSLTFERELKRRFERFQRVGVTEAIEESEKQYMFRRVDSIVEYLLKLSEEDDNSKDSLKSIKEELIEYLKK